MFVHELRTALDLLDPEYRITMAVPADESLLAWYDFDALGVERGAPAAPALPGRITLAAPYPNPFNGTVRISYTVPRPGRVLIEVSDVLGRRVARFRDEISRAGEHEISWQAEAAPAGVYFLTVHVAGGGRAAAKLVLVR
ncbi:MAG: hypothetical protein MAG453_01106 [Calditrichaeota bacterium]|nr:hypothetical protein [Calditrichota bacterium]